MYADTVLINGKIFSFEESDVNVNIKMSKSSEMKM